MHNIEMEHFVGASGEKLPVVGYAQDDRIRTANLKRRYAVSESINDLHLQAKMFKSSLVPVLATMKDYHEPQHSVHHQHSVNHQQQQSSQLNHLETSQISQHHQQNEEVIVDYASHDHNKYSNLVQQTCSDNVSIETVEYVNIMFDNNLLPVQNQIISEPNYYTDDELNSANWNNVDLLDLDQRNLFFETATTTMKATTTATSPSVSSSTSSSVFVAATHTNHQQTSGRDEFHMKTTAKSVPSKLLVIFLRIFTTKMRNGKNNSL